MNSDPPLNPPQPSPNDSLPVRHLVALLAVAGILFWAGLGRLPLVEPDEGRNAEVAREMLATGDFITPHFNTLVYLDKPVVYFWMVAASFRLAGVSEGAARLPSALTALAVMLLTWFLARRILGNSSGWRAALIFATAPLTIAFSRLVIFDMPLTLLVALALVSFWLAQESDFRRPLMDVVFFAAMGVATITKGPVGFLLPLLAVLAFQGVTGRFRDLKRFRWGVGLLVFLAVTLPWFVAVSLRHPDFPRYAFWQESLHRFATESTRRGGSFLYYLPVYLAGFFPWSLFLLFAGLGKLKQWRELRDESCRAVAYLVTWTVVIFLFFTISQSKLPGYFLPAVVPLSILTAKIWEEIEARGERRPGWLRAGFVTLMAVGTIVAATPQVFRSQAVEVAATEKVPPGVLALIMPALFYSGLILIALGIFGRNLTVRKAGGKRAVLSLVLLALTVPLLLVRWSGTISAYAAASSSRRLAEAIQQSAERDLPVYGFYCFRTSLGFYLRRPVGLATMGGSELTSNYISSNVARFKRQATMAGAEPLLVDATDIRVRALYGTRPFLVLVRNRDVWKLSRTVPEMEPLWNDWEYSVWRIPAGKGKGLRNR